MLLALKELKKLENFLEKLIKEKKIYKYRIYLNLNTTINVDIVAKESEEIKNSIENFGIVDISIDEWIDKDEYESDEYYKKLFTKKIDKEHRRRLSNLIKDNNTTKNPVKTPIISFYSYKGGVGRTTALITFANYYAYHYKKKVVILDFDFEAPGVTNYFEFSLDDLKDKNGVVEYILDKEALKEKNNLKLMQNYMIEVSKKYSNDGSIYVMPSGNLFGEENLNSYIEALARVDINSTDTIVNQINSLIDDINNIIKPDVILIDSRTGFNDIFGFLINKISSVIVGLFEENIQTKPGLKLFLKEIYGDKNSPSSIIVNSLVHKDGNLSKKRNSFKEEVYDYIINLTDENYAPNIFDLRNSAILGNLGTTDYDKDDYFEFIREFTPPDYKKFFDKIVELVDNLSKQENIIEDDKTLTINKLTIVKKNDINTLRKTLLEKIYNNYPETYAENIIYNEDFLNKKFYFRKSMEDIFNFDKFLLIGIKGTGKTAFYLALKDEDFVSNLKRKANKNQIKFTTIDIISLKESKNREKYFEIKNFNQDDIKDKDFFYKRFWIIYILNSILLTINKLQGYSASKEILQILPQKLDDSVENKLLFEDIINSDNKFILVEKELKEIDSHLKKLDLNLLITFDQLDHIVKPIFWSKAIASLIDLCRSIPYLKIQPKLFLRRDLYNRLTNLTNKQSLNSKIINLEWSKDEIFAFFFKTVFAYAKEEFFNIMDRYNDISKERIEAIKKKITKQNSFNQIDLDRYKIEDLVKTFFGEYPNYGKYSNKTFSKSYDWFYESLADSNNTISLRVFLDLIKFSIERFNSKTLKNIQPILSSYFYNNKDSRKKCVKTYFEDLASEEGNEDFKEIIEHIRDSSKFPNYLRLRVLQGKQYDELLEYFLDNVELKYSKTKSDIEETLKTNGVISIDYISGDNKKCTFAYLYKYYLGLKK